MGRLSWTTNWKGHGCGFCYCVIPEFAWKYPGKSLKFCYYKRAAGQKLNLESPDMLNMNLVCEPYGWLYLWVFMDVSISQFPEHVGKNTSGSWIIPQFRLLMICLMLAIKIPGEEYVKSGHDVLAFFHPFFSCSVYAT